MPEAPEAPEPRLVRIRAYAEPMMDEADPTGGKDKKKGGKPARNVAAEVQAPDAMLVFDTETKTDVAQALRFGTYHMRVLGEEEWGLFYSPEGLTEAEAGLLREYAAEKCLRVYTHMEWMQRVLLGFAWQAGATVVGFNLPFDLSRVALGWGLARGRFKGGFSFVLTHRPGFPRIRVRHLSSRKALLEWSGVQQDNTRSARRRRRAGMPESPKTKGVFVDVHTLGAAMTGGPCSLDTLCRRLAVEHPKLSTEEHGGPLTREYLDYAVRDVRATLDCYRALTRHFDSLGLTRTAMHRIMSEASIGKAYLREMGLTPWRKAQPDFPRDLLGFIMSTFYGGRAEVRHRREVVIVRYLDFLSMYPTVCTLQGLWRFFIAEGVTWTDATKDVRVFLSQVTLEDMRKPETWRRLPCIVQVLPQDDLFPVRASYGVSNADASIGLNRVTADRPVWYTLADCIASKMLTGKAPQVVQAVAFAPGKPQEGLRAAQVMGKAEYRIDPREDDFFRKVIDLRSTVKRRMKKARGDEKARLDAEQLTLKIIANATSYGITTEINPEDLDEPPYVAEVFGPHGSIGRCHVAVQEIPGAWFHPLLGTCITGAARLMLALGEARAKAAGLDWAFCDTDSLALMWPMTMEEEADFNDAVRSVQGFFSPLNPYEDKSKEVFEEEDQNRGLMPDGEGGWKLGTDLEPLYCYAVSAKRYALFNMPDNSPPVLRKASAHGLGHLLAPYPSDWASAPDPAPRVALDALGVSRWQHDLWQRVVRAVTEGHPNDVDLSFLHDRVLHRWAEEHPEALRLGLAAPLRFPALQRYAATTPAIMAWFEDWNRDRPYHEQVKPFGFFLAAGDVRGMDVDMDAARQSWDAWKQADADWHALCRRIMAEGGILPPEPGRAMVRAERIRTAEVASLARHIYRDAGRSWSWWVGEIRRVTEGSMLRPDGSDEMRSLPSVLKRHGSPWALDGAAQALGMTEADLLRALGQAWRTSRRRSMSDAEREARRRLEPDWREALAEARRLDAERDMIGEEVLAKTGLRRSARKGGRPVSDVASALGMTPEALIAEIKRLFDARARKPKRPEEAHILHPVAPFNRDPGRAAETFFDRDTGRPVDPRHLETYAETLADYHRHAEAKFHNGGPNDFGRTERRHVRVAGIVLVGKESSRFQEMSDALQNALDPQQEYKPPVGFEAADASVLSTIRAACLLKGGVGRLAARAHVSWHTVHNILVGGACGINTLERLLATANTMLHAAPPPDTRPETSVKEDAPGPVSWLRGVLSVLVPEWGGQRAFCRAHGLAQVTFGTFYRNSGSTSVQVEERIVQVVRRHVWTVLYQRMETCGMRKGALRLKKHMEALGGPCPCRASVGALYPAMLPRDRTGALAR